MRNKIGNKSINALITSLFYLFYTGGFGKGFNLHDIQNDAFKPACDWFTVS